jgi:peptidyl-prolyl cis-trans isomerase SurA
MSLDASSRVRRFAAWPAAAVLAGLTAACQSTPATTPAAAPPPSPDTWAVVNGRAIMRTDVEKAYRRTAQLTPAPSEDEALAAKLTLLNEFIVQDLLLEKARALKVELPDTELDTAYAENRKNIPEDRFQEELKRRNLTAEDMRDGLRRDMLVQKLLDREVNAKIVVSDQDVSDFFTQNKAQFNRPEEAFRIAQIVVTPARDPQVANRTGNDATTPQEAAAKAAMLMERLKAGATFGDVAADFSEDPDSAPRGGDLGVVPVSAIRQAPPQLRDAVLKAKPGTVTLVNLNGVQTIVLLVAREAAGQRDLSMPEVRDGITQTLRNRREQLLRAAYLGAIRNDAVVVNHLASRVVEGQGRLPNLAPTPPGGAR